jgi:hypothetical protein
MTLTTSQLDDLERVIRSERDPLDVLQAHPLLQLVAIARAALAHVDRWHTDELDDTMDALVAALHGDP